MAHNKLRRAIEQERQTSYREAHEKIAAQSALLDRALIALGGPVQDARPQQETTAPVVDTPRSEIVSSPIDAPIVGRDTGDETQEPEAPPRYVTRPEDAPDYRG